MEKFICFGQVHVETVYCLYDVRGQEIDKRITLKVGFNNDQHFETNFQISITSVVDKCIISLLEMKGIVFSCSGHWKEGFIQSMLLEINRCPNTQKMLQLPQGYSTYGGDSYWRFGNRTFTSKDNQEYLAIYHEEEESIVRQTVDECFEKAFQYCFIDKNVAPLIFLDLGSTFWYNILRDAGFSQRHTNYIVGQTGTYKSSIAREPSMVYETKCSISLSATEAALVDRIDSNRTAPMLIDDFNKSDYSAEVAERGRKLAKILQNYADNEEFVKMSGKKQIRRKMMTTLIVTAEETLKNYSTLNRCLITTPDNVDVAILSKVQADNRENGIFASLYCHLIQYTLDNEERLKKKLNDSVHRIYQGSMGYDEYKKCDGYSRVMASYTYCRAMLILWNDFMNECTSFSDKLRNEILQKMNNALEISVKTTLGFLSPPDWNKTMLEWICDAIHKADKNNRLASRKKDFEKNSKYIGVWDQEKKILYIPLEKLSDIVSAEAKRRISGKQVSDVLYGSGFLRTESSRYRSRPIPKSKSNARYLHIKMEKMFRELSYYDEVDSILDIWHH